VRGEGTVRLELLDYRRAVSEMYAHLRRSPMPEPLRCEEFRRARDRLLQDHPQSALPPDERRSFGGLRYYPYDPALRFVVRVEDAADRGSLEVRLRDDGVVRLARLGIARFAVDGQACALTVFWVSGYGGGVFLPFRDATAASETYPGGRYLLDTIKGADLGQDGDRLILDFNYAYNPSCAYDPRWDCPLAPPENWLTVPIPAGEQRYRPTVAR
jgi:uncharacterized protein (DUF1684 family)